MRRLLLLSLIVLSATAPRLVAAPADPKLLKPLRFVVRPIIPKARSHAPQFFEISLGCDSDKYFEGRLELKWYLGNRLVHDYLSPELAVAAGGRKLRVAVPPIVMHSEKTTVTARARFITSREVLELTESTPSVPVDWRRSFVIVYVEPSEFDKSSIVRSLANELGLERLGPPAEQQFSLSSHVARLLPEELPAGSAGYSGFDVLIMDREAFLQVTEAQLTAIGDWVAGGGNVVVIPHGTLTAQHVEFLNRLGGGQEAEGPYSRDERGHLVVGESALAAATRLAKFHAGAGRAVVVHGELDPESDFETPEWKAVIGFLWKVRAVQLNKIMQTGGWDFTPPPMDERYLTPRPFAPQADGLGESIRQFLMPERIEGVPLPVVAVILSLFLLAVAPGDYFLLGRLNCRKYTWWLFVLVTATCTFCTVKVAESYMGDVDYRTALTFVDLESARNDSSPVLRPARSSRFELLFVATQQAVETSLRNCLYVDLTEPGGPQEDVQYRRMRFSQYDDRELDEMQAADPDLPRFEGVMPTAFKVRQQLRQWSPRITRRTTFADGPADLPDSPITAKSLADADWTSKEGRQALFDAILQQEPAAQILLLNQNRAFRPALAEEGSANESAEKRPGAVSRKSPRAAGSAGSGDDFSNLQSQAPVLALAAKASVRPPVGLFAIVSQVSPTGGTNLEDLSLLDPSDPQQWLLIVAVRRNSDWFVFRKLLIHDVGTEGL